jgi:hypothetical protein
MLLLPRLAVMYIADIPGDFFGTGPSERVKSGAPGPSTLTTSAPVGRCVVWEGLRQ